jgi:hypothetical protein
MLALIKHLPSSQAQVAKVTHVDMVLESSTGKQIYRQHCSRLEPTLGSQFRVEAKYISPFISIRTYTKYITGL